MKNKKSILQWMEQISPEAVEECKKLNTDVDYINKVHDFITSKHEALLYAFEWDETERGFDYWGKIYYKLAVDFETNKKEKLISFSEYAQKEGISLKTVYNQIKAGALKPVIIGKAKFILHK